MTALYPPSTPPIPMPSTDSISIENHGPLILATTYWDSALEGAGLPLLSLVDSTLRMLMPRGVRDTYTPLLNAREVIVTVGTCTNRVETFDFMKKGEPATEIFCTGSGDTIYLPMRCWDRPTVAPETPTPCEFTAWEFRRVPHRFMGRRCYLRALDVPCRKGIELNS